MPLLGFIFQILGLLLKEATQAARSAKGAESTLSLAFVGLLKLIYECKSTLSTHLELLHPVETLSPPNTYGETVLGRPAMDSPTLGGHSHLPFLSPSSCSLFFGGSA